ncbi:MAG: glycosyltransferase family 9 protein [Candidatus Omnitrophota bacterium]
MKRILVANIFGIGDVLFTTPLIANLKKEMGDVEVDYLCNARARTVVKWDPDVDGIFVYEKDDLIDLWQRSKVGCIKALYDLFSSLRRKKYDAVFDFTLSRKFGFLFALAGIPRRIGLGYRKRGIFLTDKHEFRGFKGKHVVEHYLELLEYVKIPVLVRELQLVPDEESREWAAGYLRGHGVEEAPLVAVIPGGGASWGEQAFRKRWPPEGFSQAGDILSKKGIKIAALGDASETDLCRVVSEKMVKKPAIMENDLSLDKYIALLSACDLVLCNDGGPLHIAVALGLKTVSIFGPVDDKVYGPYPASSRNKVIKADELSCRPCYARFKLPECESNNRCLTDIDPEYVANSCFELLERDN